MMSLRASRAEKAKLEWLRAAAREGFEAIGHGDYTALFSDDEVCAFVKQIRDEVKTELAADRRVG